MYFCSITSNQIRDEDDVIITSYGLNFEGEFSASFEALCTDLSRIEKLQKDIEKYHPEPRHIPDLIDDYLYNILS